MGLNCVGPCMRIFFLKHTGNIFGDLQQLRFFWFSFIIEIQHIIHITYKIYVI